MSKGKYSRKRGMNLRPLILVLTVALLLGATIGGTIAWLTATTQKVENTFTVGDVSITLKETQVTVNADGTETLGDKIEGATNTYPMIPGNKYTKDPTVEVVGTSEDCYLFVEFIKTENADTYLNYTSNLTTDKGWTQGTGTIPTNVWYRQVNKSDTTKTWDLLDGNKVEIEETLTKADMAAFDTDKDGKLSVTEKAAFPKLQYKAYAVQQDNMDDAADAWAKIPTT